MEAKPIRHYKVVLLGDSSVGKSCLVTQFVRNEFHDFQEPTIGAAFLTATINPEDGGGVGGGVGGDGPVRLEIWDTAGQERYRSLAPMYYRGAAAAVVVFDLTSQESFAGAKTWVRELQRRGDANVVIGLAGNKSDCLEQRVVSADEAKSFALENSLLYLETSAKTAQNVRELFLGVASRLPKPVASANQATEDGGGISVKHPVDQGLGGNCC